MGEPSGLELRNTFLGLLPDRMHATFDDDFSLGEDDNGRISDCAAFTALGWAFDRCLKDGEWAAVGKILAEVDRLLGLHAPPPEEMGRHGTYDSALSCFVENVLPVHRRYFDQVAPLLGPNVRAFAAREEPLWLQPMD